MKKQFAFIALFVALALPHFAHAQIRLSIGDQKRFDSYYSRWQSYKASNNHSEVRSMEGRIQDLYQHYGIPANTPYSRVASNGGGWTNGGWNGNAPQPTGTARPYWERDRYRDHDRDWDRDHRWDRDHDWDRDRAREEHREWEHRRWEHEREEARHDNGLHRGWYKVHGNNPHHRDGDDDRDDDRGRDHHDRDDHRDHRDHDRPDQDHHDQNRPH